LRITASHPSTGGNDPEKSFSRKPSPLTECPRHQHPEERKNTTGKRERSPKGSWGEGGKFNERLMFRSERQGALKTGVARGRKQSDEAPSVGNKERKMSRGFTGSRTWRERGASAVGGKVGGIRTCSPKEKKTRGSCAQQLNSDYRTCGTTARIESRRA